MFVVVGALSNRVQPKYLIIAGAAFIALSMHDLTNVYGDLGFWFFATSRMTLGVGLPLIFLPIITASYDGIPPTRTDMASALINAARNTGGSMGVSLASNVLAHREQFHQSRLAEDVIPSSPQYQDTLHQATQYFLAQGSSLAQAQHQAFAWIGQQVQTQAAYLAYMDVFWVLMVLALLSIPLALTLRKVKLGGARPGGPLINAQRTLVATIRWIVLPRDGAPLDSRRACSRKDGGVEPRAFSRRGSTRERSGSRRHGHRKPDQGDGENRRREGRARGRRGGCGFARLDHRLHAPAAARARQTR